MKSTILNKRQYKGLHKVGACLLPQSQNFPSFKEAEEQASVDTILKAMNSSDQFGFKVLLYVLSFMPHMLLHEILKTLHRIRKKNSFLGTLARKVLLGLRGVTYTLYYTHQPKSEIHQNIYKEMGWDSKIKSHKENDDTYNDYFKKDLNPLNQDRNNNLSKFGIQSYQPPSLSNRIDYLWNLHDWILNQMESLIEIIQKETGKTRNEIVFTEIFSSLENIRWLIKSRNNLKTHKVKTPLIMFGKTSTISYEPIGTVLSITAWNYPFYQAIQSITASFMCGNQTILKPSEITPLQPIMDALQKILPTNSLHIIYGDGQVAEELISCHPDKIFFTGSPQTGKKLMRQASSDLIPVELELGGKDAAIVMKDAQLDRAVPGILWGSCVTSGQACSSTELVFVHETIFKEFKERIVSAATKVTVGDERTQKDSTFDYGPIISHKQISIIRDHLEDAILKGANILSGDHWDRESSLIPPIIIDNIKDNMLIAKEETFGPLIPLISFQTSEEVILQVNRTHYGLSGSIWGANKKDINYFAERLKVGSLSINNVMASEGNHNLPFGGFKNSGFGRHKGVHGLHSFTHIKSILYDKNSNNAEVNWFPYSSKQFDLSKKMLHGYYTRKISQKIHFLINGLALENLAEKNQKRRRERA